jgi:hypothetical protein
MHSDELDDIHSSSLAFFTKKVIGPFYQLTSSDWQVG